MTNPENPQNEDEQNPQQPSQPASPAGNMGNALEEAMQPVREELTLNHRDPSDPTAPKMVITRGNPPSR